MVPDVPPPPAAATVSAAHVAPRKIYLGRDPVHVRFTLSVAEPTANVGIVAAHGNRIARRLVLHDVAGSVEQRVAWDGVTGRGDAARDGRYRVRLVVPGSRRLLGRFVLRGH